MGLTPPLEIHGLPAIIVPLFSELWTEQTRHFSLDEAKGSEYVIAQYQRTTWGLYISIQSIVQRAGLGTLVRPFDNMRMSRSNKVLA